MKQLATDLWDSIQEWCEPRPKAAIAPAPAQAASTAAQLPPGIRQDAGDGKAAESGESMREDARILRQVAKGLREWARKAGTPGRRPEAVPEEERALARQALIAAVSNLEMITQAHERFGSTEGVRISGNVFEKLKTAAADHDRGADLGGYWGWAHDLTDKHLPRNVSFPDELDRWASRLEQEPAEAGQAGGKVGTGKGVADRDERMARVLIYVQRNPGVSERNVAKATHVPASTFRAWPEYQSLRKMHGPEIRKGHKTAEGDVEAYDVS